MPSIIHKIAESASLFHALPVAKLTDSGQYQERFRLFTALKGFIVTAETQRSLRLE